MVQTFWRPQAGRASAITLLLAFLLAVGAPTPAAALQDGGIPAVLRAGQDNGLRFGQITVEHGLAQNRVTSILQDAQGFIWFGTGAGLQRYDGREFLIYQHDPQDPDSLSSNAI
ncbi:MAG: two-component regulator propeller domain-containing protein, partial [Anaerolineae bacterium]